MSGIDVPKMNEMAQLKAQINQLLQREIQKQSWGQGLEQTQAIWVRNYEEHIIDSREENKDKLIIDLQRTIISDVAHGSGMPAQIFQSVLVALEDLRNPQ